MIQMQDISVFDIPVDIQTAEQKIIVQNKKLISYNYNLAYIVKTPQKPQIIEPQTETISPLVSYLIKILQTGSVTEQEKCLFVINKNIELKGNEQFLDESLTKALFNISNEDISKYKPATVKQKFLRKKIQEGKKLSKKDYVVAYNLSEQEKAQNNQITAILLIAKIQNVLYKEIKQRSDLEPKFSDLPAVPKLIAEIENNKNETVRIAAVEAIGSMYRYEFFNDICAVLESIEKTANSQDVQKCAAKTKSEIVAVHKKQEQKLKNKVSSYVF
ncbi:MAG: hypothetical protein ACI37T_06145 [Candidatus Gastranaerophilaceae bacterium]